MFRWYLALARNRPLLSIVLLFGTAIAISAVARSVLGPRGSLVPELLYLCFGIVMFGFVARLFLRAAFSLKLSTPIGIVVLGIAVLPTAFTLFIAWQSLLLAADLVLPFDHETAVVVAWRYDPGARAPGHLKLLTADGATREMPAFDLYAGPRNAGPYELEVTRFQRLVVDAHPLAFTR